MRLAFAGLICLVVLAGTAAAQSDNPLRPQPRPKRFFIGPLGGYNTNFHSGGFTSFAGNAQCGDFTTGGGNGIIGGLSAEYWFKVGGPTALQIKAYYEQKPGTFDAQTDPLLTFDVATQRLITVLLGHQTKVVYNMANAEVLYKYDFPSTRFGIVAGPKVGVVLNTSLEQKQFFKPPTPDNVTFVDGTRENILVPAGEIPDKSGIRLALKAGIQYEFLLDRFLVSPQIYYDYGITQVSSGGHSWRVSSLSFTAEIKYGI